ncbi:MAG: hypothetical protein AMJ88_13555 [Anaerolineae bacterium SM23_ 63]|nr:MAG: hypothetical protein AMJ88_13555 [Anaerolineae bacterium SM23_ 63]
MKIDQEEFQALVIEFRTFATKVELKLQAIDNRLEALGQNSNRLKGLAQKTPLVEQEQEHRWKMHNADHQILSEDVSVLQKRIGNIWQYVLIAVISGLVGSSIVQSFIARLPAFLLGLSP